MFLHVLFSWIKWIVFTKQMWVNWCALVCCNWLANKSFGAKFDKNYWILFINGQQHSHCWVPSKMTFSVTSLWCSWLSTIWPCEVILQLTKLSFGVGQFYHDRFVVKRLTCKFRIHKCAMWRSWATKRCSPSYDANFSSTIHNIAFEQPFYRINHEGKLRWRHLFMRFKSQWQLCLRIS